MRSRRIQPNIILCFCVLLTAGCTDITTFGSSSSTGAGSSDEGSEGFFPTTSAGPADDSSSTTEGSSTAGSDSSGAVSNAFLDDTDTSSSCGDALPDGVVGLTIECSLFDQDCCPGEACRSWANDGGSSWNASRCVPVDAEPGQVDEACTVQGSGYSGVDSCDVGLMCWDVDPDTLAGTCIDYCDGDETEPTCSRSEDVCTISNDGSLPVCLPSCDPLLSDCDSGDACAPRGGEDTFVCVPQRYVPCPAGTTEVSQAPGCGEDEPCCSPYCDLSDDASCGEDLGCLPLPEPYAAYPDLGVCGPLQ